MVLPSKPPGAPPLQPQATGDQRPPLVQSAKLFQGHRTVEISHNGELYRLQATRLGKLILTK